MTIFLFSLILLSVVGVQFVNVLHSNVLLLILFPLLALVPVLITLNFIPKKLYPLAIVTTALALLFSASLISSQFYGADVNQEYYFANLVKNNSFWDQSIANDYNTVLSITMLAPIFSLVSTMDLLWVFKIVYPLLFSLVPLVLYLSIKKMTGSKTAVLSIFFFMFVSTFFTEMLNVARQQIAEIFVALLILLVMTKRGHSKTGVFLSIVLAVGLVFSHYALSYIFLFCLISSALVLMVFRKVNLSNVRIPKIFRNIDLKVKSPTIHKLAFVALFMGLVISWYSFVSTSVSFDKIVEIGNSIVSNIVSDFFNPHTAQGLSLITRQTASLTHEFTKDFNILMQIFIVVGVLLIVLKPSKKFNKEYVSLSIVNLVLCIAAIAVPFLASNLNTTRLYHITLLFLSPFCIIGIMFILRLVSKRGLPIVKKPFLFSKSTAYRIVAIILSLYLLFGSGYIYEITQNHPYSVSFSQNSIVRNGSDYEKIRFYNAYTPLEEAVSAQWLSVYKEGYPVYSDYRARTNVLNAFAMISRDNVSIIYDTTPRINGTSYVYLRAINVADKIMGGSQLLSSSASYFNATIIVNSLAGQANKVYNNGASEIYYTLYSVNITN